MEETEHHGSPGPGVLVAGRYRLERVVGGGGFGVVYKALDESSARPVALKFLRGIPMHADGGGEARARFAREWLAGSRVAHPNIVATLDHGESHGVPYIVMEFVPGRTLAEAFPLTGTPMAREDAARILEQVLYALNHAHMVGIIHRDVKPSNILLDENGAVRLSDFGVSKIVETFAGPLVTQTGTLGTPSFMSPEQARGSAIDHRSDLFSVGLIAFELFTGRRAFDGHPLAVIHRILSDAPPDDPGLLSPVREWIRRACAKEPDERFSSAHEMRWELQETLRRLGTSRSATPKARRVRSGGQAAIAARGLAGTDSREGDPSLLATADDDTTVGRPAFRLAIVAGAVLGTLLLLLALRFLGGRPSSQDGGGWTTMFRANDGVTAYVPPAVIGPIRPQWPSGVSGSLIRGVVTVSAVVSPSGEVTRAEVVKPLDPILDAVALRTARALKYRPATCSGKPCEANLLVDVPFEPF